MTREVHHVTCAVHHVTCEVDHVTCAVHHVTREVHHVTCAGYTARCALWMCHVTSRGGRNSEMRMKEVNRTENKNNEAM